MRTLLANDEYDELFYLINDPDIEVIDDEDELENKVDISFISTLFRPGESDMFFILKEPNIELKNNDILKIEINHYHDTVRHQISK